MKGNSDCGRLTRVAVITNGSRICATIVDVKTQLASSADLKSLTVTLEYSKMRWAVFIFRLVEVAMWLLPHVPSIQS